MAGLLGLVGQVVGVHADAVATDETGAEGQEVPLGAGRLEHGVGVDPEAFEDHRELVDQGDVQVALGVLDDLRGFRGAQVRDRKGAGADDAAVQGVHERQGPGRGAGGHLDHVGQAMGLVPGIDPFGAVADEEALVVAQSRLALEQGYADLLRGAGIDRRFVHHDRAGRDHAAHHAARGFERGKVRPLVGVDGGGHRDHEHIAALQVVEFRGERQARLA